MFVPIGICYSNTLRPRGLDGILLQKERRQKERRDRSNQSGDDMKDEVRTDNDWYAWNYWQTVQAQLWQLRVPGPPVEFAGEHGILEDIYAQVREEERFITLQFLRGQQDISTCRMKKRKQVDDTAGIT